MKWVQFVSAFQKQSDELWRLRKDLQEQVHKGDWKALLEENDQELAKGDDKVFALLRFLKTFS